MIRIVKLTFRPEHSQDFIEFIEGYREKISSQPGCHGVQFLRDNTDPHIFFTYSHWENEASLNTYRDSELFKMVWTIVKQWFGQKAEAWSVEKF